MAYSYQPPQKQNFGSGISTGSPFAPTDIRTASNVRQAYMGPDQSRSAFARALTDTSKAEIKNAFSGADREYRQKAEALRARDVQAQRENRSQRFAMQREKQVTMKKQDVGLQQNLADLEAYRIRGEKDARIQGINSIAGTILGVAAAATPTSGWMAHRWGEEDRRGAGRSVFGWGLLR